MKKNLMFMAAAAACFGLLTMTGCEKDVNENQDGTDGSASLVKISPTLTRVGDTSFDENDKIGVSISIADEVYAGNELMSFSQGTFTGTLTWYADSETASDIVAYYPYNESGVPETFSVEADQSKGTSASDFIIGSAENVKPSEEAVAMTFKHVLSKVVIDITNDTGSEITSVVLKGSKRTADISVAENTVAVSATVAAEDITAYPAAANESYYAILVPQTVGMTLEIKTADSETYTEELEEIALVKGGQHPITARISIEKGLQVKVAGEVEDWTDEDEIGPKPDPAISIEKQWVAETEQEGMIVKQCFDIGVGVEGGLLIGQYNDLYASMLPEGADPEKSYIAMIYSADEIVNITETNGTSGTVAYKTDTDGDGTAETDMSLSYSNLTETSVTINYTDVYGGNTTTLDCTVAPEGTKVYTMMDLM